MQVIYKIENLINNKLYIGSTIQYARRKRDHFSLLKSNKHTNKHLQSSYNKYGKQNFKISIIEIIDSLDYEYLLEREQYHIDNTDVSLLYNMCYDVKAGGYEVNQIENYLLNLKGDIIKKFNSLQETSRFLGKKGQGVTSKSVNKSSTVRNNEGRAYRVVTIDFYDDNYDIISKWKPYTCKSTYESNLKTKIIIYNDNDSKEFNTMVSCGKFLNISRERVRQIIISKNIHKKSGYYIKKVVIDTNIY